MVIKSILDTDLYKFSVSYAYFTLYPNAQGKFKFVDRNKEDWRGTDFVERFTENLRGLRALILTEKECNWCIANIPYIPAVYWEWLKSFRYKADGLTFGLDKNGVFTAETTHDYLCKVTLWEIAVLAIYSETRTQWLIDNGKITAPDFNTVRNIVKDKIAFTEANGLKFSEFGTRRRFSYAVQAAVCEELKNCKMCAGTSNVHLAMLNNMCPIGTFPHEWVMFHAGVFGYKRANYLSLEDWINVYDGNLGTALIDTYTTKSFLHTLTRKQALLLSGFRQDSGDEVEVGEMIIARLKEFGIDPTTKLLVFSNALDFNKYKKIHDYFKGKIKVSAGIGGNLTNDVAIAGYIPANIVMKLSECRLSSKDSWEKCIKISDDTGKHMGDPEEFNAAVRDLKLAVTY